MVNKFIPNDLMKELLEFSKELEERNKSYIPKLTILFDNMNESRYYSGAKKDLWEYINLVAKTPWTADDFERRQALYEKLQRGNVITRSIEYASNIPWESGKVVSLSRARANNLLDGR